MGSSLVPCPGSKFPVVSPGRRFVVIWTDFDILRMYHSVPSDHLDPSNMRSGYGFVMFCNVLY